MNIYITTIKYRDNIEDRGKLVDLVAKTLRENFQDKSFGITIETVWFYLDFLPPDYPDSPSVGKEYTLRRKKKELAISSKIMDYDTFITGDRQTCLNLIAKTLLATIPKAKDAKVKDFSLEAFQLDCYNLFVDQQWLEK